MSNVAPPHHFQHETAAVTYTIALSDQIATPIRPILTPALLVAFPYSVLDQLDYLFQTWGVPGQPGHTGDT